MTDTYTGEDGLQYCAVCNAPLEYKTELFGHVIRGRAQCLCEQAAYAARQKADEERELQLRAERLRERGITDKQLLGCRFDQADDNEIIRRCKEYVQHWDEMSAGNYGLLLWGGTGTGKSYAAACVANALIDKGITVRMNDIAKILSRINGAYADARAGYLQELADAGLLIIDDLGVERHTEYALEQVFLIINERYKAKKPLIVTTNMSINAIRHPADLQHQRICSRLLEMCTPVKVVGEDRRADIAEEKMDYMRKKLQ